MAKTDESSSKSGLLLILGLLILVAIGICCAKGCCAGCCQPAETNKS